MGYIPIEVQYGSQESMWMKKEANLALGGFWELIAEEQMLRKVNSDNGYIMLSRSVTR